MESQATRLRQLLVQLIQQYDASIDVSDGSAFVSQVVDPFSQALGTDPMAVDSLLFLRDRLAQEYPSLSGEEGDVLFEALIRPLQLLIEPLRREIQQIQLGASTQNAQSMREADMDALAANWFVQRAGGSRTQGSVRLYFTTASFVSVSTTAVFQTAGGLRFFPMGLQTFSADTVLTQTADALYYVDVRIIAEFPGDTYRVEKGAITQVTGVANVVRVTNLTNFTTGGVARESNLELAASIQSAQTERSLVTRRGITQRLKRGFPDIRSLEVTGAGDPEMERDIVEGTSEGTVRASGVCFVVGSYCLFFSQYTDRGTDGTQAVQVGDTLTLNYWGFLYDVPDAQRHETFAVQQVLFDSWGSLRNFPSIYLLRMGGTSSVAKSVLGLLPGILPGVFGVLKGPGRITLSRMPGGMAPEVLEDGVLHIGGHYDVWLRPAADEEATTSLPVEGTPVVEGFGLSTFGGTATPNQITLAYQLQFEGTGTLLIGATVTGLTSGAVGTLQAYQLTGGGRGVLTLASVTGTFQRGESVTVVMGMTTTTVEVTSVASDLANAPVRAGMLLRVLSGADIGVYRILAIADNAAWLDADLTAAETDLRFRVLSSGQVNAFAPRVVRIPFADAHGDDLTSTVGSPRVRLGVDAARFGVVAGDQLEILSGPDRGLHTIVQTDPVYGSFYLILEAPLSATSSQVSYTIYAASEGLSRPLVRILPDGVAYTDANGQTTGDLVPYALPVDARPQDAFSGSKQVAAGLNGFVLPDPGEAWLPTEDTPAVRQEGLTTQACFTEGCLEVDGVIACATVLSTGAFYINAAFPTAVASFYTELKEWILSVLRSFSFEDDVFAFVQGASPIHLGSPTPALHLTACLRYFQVGEVITGGTSGATATVETVEIVGIHADTTFIDGETVSNGMGASATLTIRSSTESVFTNTVGQFANGQTLTGATSAATAVLTNLQETVTFLLSSTSFQEDEVITGSTSTATGVVDHLEVPLFQFEIVLPYSLFDGCTNVFLALPEFDWEATLGEVESLTEAVDVFLNGDLNGRVPALASARQGDALILPEGPNAGTYSIRSVTRYALCTVASIVEGAVDLDRAYQVVAVQIDNTFPVAPLGNLSDFFDSGVPDATSLPTAPAFPGLSFDSSGASQSPWEWVGQTLNWLLKFLVALGFDVPSSVEINPRELLKTLWQLLFTPYTVSRPSADQTVRLYFVEPTSCYVRAPTPCTRLTYHLPETTPAVATGLTITVPIADVEGLTAAIDVHGLARSGQLTGDLDAAFATVETVSDLATLLQDMLDAEGVYLAITGPDTATGALTVTTLEEGQEVFLSVGADEALDAMRAFGFEEGAESARLTAGPATAPLTTRVALDPDTPAGFRIEYALGGPPIQVDIPVTAALTEAREYTYTELASILEAQLLDSLSALPDLVVTVTWSETLWNFVIVIEATGLTSLAVQAPGGLVDIRTELFGAGVVVTGTNPFTITGDPATTVADLSYTVEVDGVPTVVDPDLTYAEAVSLTDAIEEAIAGDADALAIALNALARVYGDPDRQVWFVGGTTLGVRTTATGALVTVTLDTAPGDGFLLLGFPDPSTDVGTDAEGNAQAQGATTEGDAQVVVWEPPVATRLIGVEDGVPMTVVPSPDADAWTVFPAGVTDPTLFLRDVRIGSDFESDTTTVSFSDTEQPVPAQLGIEAGGDFLEVYAQRVFLELDVGDFEADVSEDRVIAVTTQAGSSVISLPTLAAPAFTFFASDTGESQDVPQVGDLVFLEEGSGAGGYVIRARTRTTLTLDRAIPENTERIYRAGNDGTIVLGTAVLSSATAAFTSADVGRYLTLWATNRQGYDGSYAILSVADLGGGVTSVTVDTDVFPSDETLIHWAVVAAPTEDPADSETGGRTALLGMRPLRVYAGTPTRWRIVSVPTLLLRTEALAISYEGEERPPRGVLQPYRIVRPGMQGGSSTTMQAQQAGGLYYLDIQARVLGPDAPAPTTRLEPVFGTYQSDGYWWSVADPRYAYSAQEEADLITSVRFLPAGAEDRPESYLPIPGRTLQVSHAASSLVGQVQQFLDSSLNRVVCADPLARHYLPAYVYLSLSYRGSATASSLVGAIHTYFQNLPATTPVSLADVERILARYGVTWDHDASLAALVHDLDRRLVVDRGDLLGTEEVYNGSPRTTFYVTGEDTSIETALVTGEQTKLTQKPTQVR